MSKIKSADKSLLIIFFTAFMDLLGIGIVVPVLGPLFLDPTHGLFPYTYSLQLRTLILGILVGLYPFGQFFGAPILGAISDRIGRKKVLVLSLIGTFFGYILFGFGVVLKNFWILFAGRLIDGFTGGNISTVYSVVADVSDEKSKPKNFGLIGVALGIGFILGPFIGGVLSDKTVVSWFSYATPFWFCVALSFLNVLFVSFFFKETLKEKLHSRVDVFTGFKNIYLAFKMENLRIMFLVTFLLGFGFNLFAQFFSVYLIQKFRLNQAQIGSFFAYIGIWIAISQGGVTRFVAKKISSVKVLPVAAFLLAVSLFILIFPSRKMELYLILPLIAIFQGLVQPNGISIISNLAKENSQGEIMGINQSLQSIAQTIPPIIDGVIIAMNIHLPMIAAASCTFLAWFIFVFLFNKSSVKKFEEA